MFLNIEYYLSFLLFILSLAFTLRNKQIISLLIILELIILILLVFSLFIIISVNGSADIFLVLLTFAACEAAIGLSVLIKFIKLYGNDFYISISSLKWFA